MLRNQLLWALFLCFFSESVIAQNLLNPPCIHAHNDYLHKRPLFDAIDAGACSIEVDTYQQKGKLWVAHLPTGAWRRRGFEELYLKPLAEIVKKNNGSVYGDGLPIYLYIDTKTNTNEAMPHYEAVLKKYEWMLSKFSPTGIDTQAVMVVISGMDRQWVHANKTNLYAVAGYPGDVDCPDSTLWKFQTLNASWSGMYKYRGKGAWDLEEKKRFEESIAKANARGLKTRFWGKPDNPKIWKVQADAGVTLMHTDKLKKMKAFLEDWKKRR